MADPFDAALAFYNLALGGDAEPVAMPQGQITSRAPPARASDAARRRNTVLALDPAEPAPGQQAGVAEALMIPGAPLRPILAGLGAAYGYAAGADAGLWGSPAEAQGKRQPAAPQAPDTLPPALARRWQELTARQQKDRWLPPAEREELKGLNAAVSSAASTRAQGQAAEYDRSVKKAETARDFELSRNRRFSDTATGQLWEKTGGAAPLLAGVGAGVIGRMASGGGNAIKNYVAPAVEGAVAGATAANIPLGYNAFFTEPDNPERRAYEAYSRELPPDHPRKAEWLAYAQGLPQANPVREVASQEFFDPRMAGKRMGFGGVEGLGGALLGSGMVRAPGMIAEGIAAMPGRIVNAYRGAMAAAQPPVPRPPAGGPPALPPPPAPGPPGGGPAPGALPQAQAGPIGPPNLPPAPNIPPPGRPRSRPAPPSGGSYESAVHTPVSREYVDELLAAGQPIPSAAEMSAALAQRYASAGAPAVSPASLSAKANPTRRVLEAIADAPPEVQRTMLNRLLGQPGFLAVPAAAGAGGAVNNLLGYYQGQQPLTY